jgi:general secretion pathway protein K
MNLRPARPNSGIALIVVMIAIAVLMALAFHFAFAMKIETRLATNADSEQQMLWLGRAGVETARWVLSQDPPASIPYQSLNQIWAGGPGAMAETNSVMSGFSMSDIPVGGGTITIKIVDLERKVNINTATAMQIQQVLTVMGVNADSISVVSDSILDWVNPESAPRPAGAESDYYQGLIPPYYAKNAPMDDPSELLLVKGVTPEMYWGGSAGNHAPAAFQHKLGFGNAPGEEPDYPFGLKDIFTPISSGKININTADANVLQTIPGVDAQEAAEIIKQRAGPDGVDGTADDTPFMNPGQLAAIDPQLNGQLLNQICDVRSRTFEVHITAQIGSYQREYVSILWVNNPKDIQILGFWWK